MLFRSSILIAFVLLNGTRQTNDDIVVVIVLLLLIYANLGLLEKHVFSPPCDVGPQKPWDALQHQAQLFVVSCFPMTPHESLSLSISLLQISMETFIYLSYLSVCLLIIQASLHLQWLHTNCQSKRQLHSPKTAKKNAYIKNSFIALKIL